MVYAFWVNDERGGIGPFDGIERKMSIVSWFFVCLSLRIGVGEREEHYQDIPVHGNEKKGNSLMHTYR